MQLEKHIASLLKHHNCVIVPEFGGFIANYESAWINRSRALIFPPYKQILFNGNLTQNDGLLANELVLKASMTYPQALQAIATQVKNWRQQLEAGDRIELEEIGFLFLQHKQVVFEQNREVNLLLQAYGLKQVSFVDYAAVNETAKQTLSETLRSRQIPVVQQNPSHKEGVKAHKPLQVHDLPAEKETPVIALNTAEEIEVLEPQKDAQPVISIAPKKSRNYKYAVAAAVVMPLMFYAYWIPMKTDFLNTGKIQLSDFNPFNPQAKTVYAKRDSAFSIDTAFEWKSWEELTAGLPADVSVYNLELTDEIYVPVRLSNTAVPANSSAESGQFQLIAGCFSVEANANNLVEKLVTAGYPARVVDKKGNLYRVSAGSFETQNEAESALGTFKNEGFSGWILKQ